jgi:hypothetical protein
MKWNYCLLLLIITMLKYIQILTIRSDNSLFNTWDIIVFYFWSFCIIRKFSITYLYMTFNLGLLDHWKKYEMKFCCIVNRYVQTMFPCALFLFVTIKPTKCLQLQVLHYRHCNWLYNGLSLLCLQLWILYQNRLFIESRPRVYNGKFWTRVDCWLSPGYMSAMVNFEPE